MRSRFWSVLIEKSNAGFPAVNPAYGDRLGLPLIPEQLISTYEISIEEVVSSSPNRLIVFEGAEERLTQVSVGVLERLGIGRPPWEREEEEAYYTPAARPENQLGTGIPLRTPVEAAKPVEERWSEDEWEKEPLRANPPPQKRAEARYYEEEYEEEEDNWGEAHLERTESFSRPQYDDYEDKAEDDMWDDDVEPDYNPPRINITEKKKERIPEYEDG